MRLAKPPRWLAAAVWGVLLSAQPRVDLQLEAPGTSPEIAARFRQLDTSHLAAIARLVGIDEAGAPIRVILAPEESELARETPPWIAGFAVSSQSTVVLFPSRAPRYPDESLEALLNHEIAHVLIHRAADGHAMPRWFNEGLATTVERAWSFDDARHLAWAIASGRDLDLAALDREFGRGAAAAARAYAVSGAFVRSVVDRHGPGAPAAILAGLARSLPFDDAYLSATGESLDDAAVRFRREVTSWERVIPILASPFVLWTGISLLALYAIHVHRRRRRERRARWPDDGDPLGAGADEAGSDRAGSGEPASGT